MNDVHLRKTLEYVDMHNRNGCGRSSENPDHSAGLCSIYQQWSRNEDSAQSTLECNSFHLAVARGTTTHCHCSHSSLLPFFFGATVTLTLYCFRKKSKSWPFRILRRKPQTGFVFFSSIQIRSVVSLFKFKCHA